MEIQILGTETVAAIDAHEELGEQNLAFATQLAESFGSGLRDSLVAEFHRHRRPPGPNGALTAPAIEPTSMFR